MFEVSSTEDIAGNAQRVSISFPRLPKVVKPGDQLFLNDGLVQLVVERVVGNDVHCRVTVGGELRSKKGLNLPGIDLGISVFTDHDRACLAFAMKNGVDAVSQSFVETAADIETVRAAAKVIGKQPFIIAKIERLDALKHFDEILKVTDGIMVARGDLGVEVPIEEMAILQKQLIAKASLAGKPVITATQMLESMVSNRLPTRAESTDVANAILDGTDCVMLSGESAMGKYPEEAVAMLAKIAAFTEAHRPPTRLNDLKAMSSPYQPATAVEAIASVVEHALETVPCAAVFVPTRTGTTARMISRFNPAVWIVALSCDSAVCQGLAFSYGVHADQLTEDPKNWRDFARNWLRAHQLLGAIAMLVAGPSTRNPPKSGQWDGPTGYLERFNSLRKSTMRWCWGLNFRGRTVAIGKRRQPLQTSNQVINPQVRVAIHRQADGRVPGQHLGGFRRTVGSDQVRDESVAQ